jgi:phosphate:Na+ symporter
MSLASNVLVAENIDSARVLLEGKSELSILVSKSRKKHLKRLHNGSNISIESSDIHLETLRELKEFNSLVSTVGYPVLYRNGQLLESRLITEMPDAIS